MTSHEPDPTPEPTQYDATPAAPAVQGSTASRPASAWIWLITLAAGLAAGFGSWLLAEPIYGLYPPARAASRRFHTREETAAIDLAREKAMILEASLTFGTLVGHVACLWP
jgi:hypothetical protein